MTAAQFVADAIAVVALTAYLALMPTHHVGLPEGFIFRGGLLRLDSKGHADVHAS